MNGRASVHQALIDVTFRADDRSDLALEFVIDTGFTGELTLPPAAVQRLELPRVRQITASLADDSTIFVNVHVATIIWDGDERAVEVLATGARPLLGTLLLDGYELIVQFAEGGAVTVEPF
jgi:clan AA aspartic protease